MSHPTPTVVATDGILSHAAAPSKPQQGSIPTASLQAILAAHNAANLASGYIEKGNLPAARRQLVQALSHVNRAAEGGAQ